MTEEERRLQQARDRIVHWKRWGPYVSDRAWGTVREDYSPHGTAWESFPHDHARSRAYRWNEDGIAGFSDRHQRICLALALWNGRDPILKERFFGLTGNEGNHGEDVNAINRGPDPARLHLLPSVWFRNTWSWGNDAPRPSLGQSPDQSKTIVLEEPYYGWRWLHCDADPELLFTENETNFTRLYGAPNRSRYVKDAFHERLVHGRGDAVNPDRVGTKAAARYVSEIGPGETFTCRLRFTDQALSPPAGVFDDFDRVLAARRTESDQAKQVVGIVQRELLTPYGLRTLAPGDPRYRGRYEGDTAMRDSGYHQGAAWPWLMGPFVTAYLNVNRRRAAARRQAEVWLRPLHEHLREAGLGQISEIFDGDPPYTPRGCIAQAWSVAALLRAASECGSIRLGTSRLPRITQEGRSS